MIDILNSVEYYSKTKENQYLERKSAKIKTLDILKHLVGFANAEGGQLVIGIEDNGDITGFNYNDAHKIEEYKNINIIKLVETPIIVKFNTINVKNIKGIDDKILVITVDASTDRVIKSYDNKVYLRQLDNTVELKFDQILELQNDRGQRYFEDELVEFSSINDIDEEILKEYKNIMGVPNIDTVQLLESRNFMRDGKLTNAGILLFSKNPTKFLPQARLRVIKYDGLAAGVGRDINIIKERTFDGNIPKIIREAKEFISAQLREFQYLDFDGKFKIMSEYPEFAWFEGVVNALVHRNYMFRGEHIKVILYEDRLEILSPGLLPNIVSLKNILNTRYSRNPKIARTLTEFGWVKEMNEGVKRIYSEMEKYFLNKPIYSEPNYNVVLVLENNILNRNVRISDKFKEIIGDEKFLKLNADERCILHYMYNTGEKMTRKLSTEILKKGNTYCNKLLKTLEKKDILKWNGLSKTDKTQYYTLNF